MAASKIAVIKATVLTINKYNRNHLKDKKYIILLKIILKCKN